MGSITKTLASIVVGASLVLPGCSQIRVPEPKDEYFQNGPVSIIEKTYDSEFGREMYILDVDNDGVADIIHRMGNGYWVAPGYESYQIRSSDTLTMTPEIREAATREMKAEKELVKLLAYEAYIFDQERIKGGQN